MSTDSGETWATVPGTSGDEFPRGSALDIVASTSWLYVCEFGGQCFRSGDGGTTWLPLAFQAPSRLYPTIAVDDAGETVLVARDVGIQRSTDAGATWAEVLHVGAGSPGGRMVAFDPWNPGVAYVGTNFNGYYYRSTDSGATWDVPRHYSDGPVFDFAFDPVTSSVWAGNGVSDFENSIVAPVDGPTTPPWISGVTALHHADSAFFAGTNRGIFETTPDLSNWLPVDTLESLHIYSIDSDASGRVYAGSGGGLLVSTDSGTTWTKRQVALGAEVFSVAGDGGAETTFYAGTTGGLFKTTDDGSTWQPLTGGFGYRLIEDMATGSRPGTIYVAPYRADVYRSTDGGDSWDSIGSGLHYPGLETRLAVAPSDGHTLWAVMNGVLRVTENGGRTWKSIASVGRILAFNPDPIERAIYIAPDSDQAVIFKYDAQGLVGSWDVEAYGLYQTDAVAVAPSRPSTIYAGSVAIPGIWRSTDSGASWSVNQSAGTSIGDAGVRTILVDPRNDKHVRVGTYWNGILESTDGGDSWQPFAPGLPSPYVSVLTTSPQRPRKLVAGTFEAGGLSVLQIAPPGDVNADGAIDVRDVFSLIDGLFAGQAFVYETGDVNGDGVVDVMDVFYLINYLFAAGAPPWSG